MTRNLWLRHINQTIYGGWFTKGLVRLSHMYTHKNAEVTEEKEKLKELVSDISHQTKTPIANVKLYLELLADKNDEIEEDDILKKLGDKWISWIFCFRVW